MLSGLQHSGNLVETLEESTQEIHDVSIMVGEVSSIRSTLEVI
jgi:hypothetical protein